MNFGEFGKEQGSSGVENILDLSKGDILDLTKVAPSLKNVIVGAGWDVNESGHESFDLDISAFLLDSNDRITREKVKERVVYFKKSGGNSRELVPEMKARK